MRTRITAAGAALGLALLASGCASATRAGAAKQPAAMSLGPSVSARACPPAWSPPPGQGVAVDYVDTVHIAGHEFLYEPGADPAAAHPVLGTAVGRVLCQITAHQVDPAYRLKDGDATYLPVGTVLYAVVGLNPAQAIAVQTAGTIRLYRTP
jgi:hypothetical protein